MSLGSSTRPLLDVRSRTLCRRGTVVCSPSLMCLAVYVVEPKYSFVQLAKVGEGNWTVREQSAHSSFVLLSTVSEDLAVARLEELRRRRASPQRRANPSCRRERQCREPVPSSCYVADSFCSATRLSQLHESSWESGPVQRCSTSAGMNSALPGVRHLHRKPSLS